MPERQATITVNDDGTINLERFADDPDLTRVKQLIDGLRGSVEELKPKAARLAEYERLGSTTDIATWKQQAGEAQTLRDRITELEGTAGMTDAERQELEQAKQQLARYGDLDPDKAKEALDFQQRTLQEQQLAAAIETAGMNPKAALRLDGIRTLETRIQTEQKDGKPVKIAQAKVGDEWKPLAEHIESEYSDFLPVLKPEQGTAGTKGAGGALPKHSGPNPWKHDTRNLTEQARILREDPALAERLKAAAKE